MKLFIHHTDLDGISCYILASYLKDKLDIFDFQIADYKDFEDDQNSFPWSRLEKNENYDTIVFADITPSKKCMQLIQESNMDCIILDHHVGIYQEITDWGYAKKQYFYNVEKSGTELLHDWILSQGIETKEIIKQYVTYVTTYDLYKKDSQFWPMAESLNRLIYQMGIYGKNTPYEVFELFINSMTWKFNNRDTFSFSSFEQTKIDQSKKKEDDIFNSFMTKKREIKTRIDKEGKYFSIIKLESKISAIASRLLERFSKLDYLIIINEYDKSKVKVSLRSKDINLLEYEGTAGHEHACGLKDVDLDFINNLWIGKIYCLEKRGTL